MAFHTDGVIQFGQILAVRTQSDDEPADMVEIAAGTGLRWVPLSDTVRVSDVGYALMYDQQVDASGHFNLARVRQVCADFETVVLAGSRDITAIMSNVIFGAAGRPTSIYPSGSPFFGKIISIYTSTCGGLVVC